MNVYGYFPLIYMSWLFACIIFLALKRMHSFAQSFKIYFLKKNAFLNMKNSFVQILIYLLYLVP